MQISEPATMATDYLLAILCIALGLALLRLGGGVRETSIQLWGWALLVTAGGAVAGGTYHGFTHHLGPEIIAALWKVTVYSIGAAALLMLAAALLSTLPRRAARWGCGLAAAKFLFYLGWIATHEEFRYVVYDYVPNMMAVLLLHSFRIYTRRDAASRWIIAGVVVSFVGAGIQQSGWTLHAHFNHNDLFHVVQMAAMYSLYRGARQLRAS